MNTYNKNIDFKKFPDKNGRFGEYGGRFVAETLMPLLLDLEREYRKKLERRYILSVTN